MPMMLLLLLLLWPPPAVPADERNTRKLHIYMQFRCADRNSRYPLALAHRAFNLLSNSVYSHK